MERKKKGGWKKWISVITVVSATATTLILNVGKICTFVGNQFYDKTPPNYAVAFRFYQIGANANNAEAEYRLGYMYENGIGTEVNERQAMKYYGRANNQGLYSVVILPTPVPTGMPAAEPQTLAQDVAPVVEEETTPVTLEEVPAVTTAEETPSPAPTIAPIATVKPKEITASQKKTIEYLSGKVQKGIPVSAYDPAEGEESFPVYDNAMAALALLMDDNSRSKKQSSSDARAILDEMSARVKDGSILTEDATVRDLAALAIAFLKADQAKSTTAYVRSASTVLDWVIDNCKGEEGGFRASSLSQARSTSDNLWLYAAFMMAHDKTGNKSYDQMIDVAEGFVQSMHAADGTFYMAGDFPDAPGKNELLSAEAQAMAVLVLHDRLGLERAEGLRRADGGYQPDEASPAFSSESTLLIALAYQSLGVEEKAAQGLSAVIGTTQLGNGSILESDQAEWDDSLGIRYTNLPRTAASAWFLLTVEKKNPFVT